MRKKTLFAWASPAAVSGSPWDHTWVTSYDNRQKPYPNIQAVISAKQNYWFSWGSFHPHGGTPTAADGFIGSQRGVGVLIRANCFALSNADSRQVDAARGTIFVYGVDGVCHQLSNQILYATKDAQNGPLTVASARGYHVSTFLYGNYGFRHLAWENKVQNCTQATPLAAAERGCE